jgi:hypothetical protein
MPVVKCHRVAYEAKAIQWTGDNESEVTEFVGPHRFNALECCPEDVDATAELRHEVTGAPVLLYTGDWIVRHEGFWAYSNERFTQRFFGWDRGLAAETAGEAGRRTG